MAVAIKGKSAKQLMEERADLFKKAQAHHEENSDNWTAEHDAKHKEMMSDASDLLAGIKRLREMESMGAQLVGTDGAALHLSAAQAPAVGASAGGGFAGGNPGQGLAGYSDDDPMGESAAAHGGRRGGGPQRPMLSVRQGTTENGRPRYVRIPGGYRSSEDYNKSFTRALMTGYPQAGMQITTTVDQDGMSQYATLQSDDAQRGGYLLVPEQFAAELLREVDDLLFVMQRARVHTVPTADTLGIKKRTSRANTFAWSTELEVADHDSSLTYGKKILTPHHLTGSVPISRDLARRESLIVSEVRSELARNGGEVMEDGFLTGHGARQPLGVFTASDDGISTARDVDTGSTTGFTSDGLISAKYNLKSQYRTRQRGELSWLFHRNAIEKIALLKDANNQYLFRVGAGFAADNQMPEDRLLDYPVDESERAPNTFTAGNYVGLLANWRYYEIAMALDMEIQVLMELRARSNEIEYIARLKVDGMPTLEEAFVRLKTDDS